MTHRHLLVTGLALVLSACLDPNAGKTNGSVQDIATPDASADAAGETQSDTATPNLCLDILCDDGNPCTENRCDPATGCFFPAMADGASCGPCDACQSGVCEQLPPPPIEAPECSVDSDCDDGNPCTTDSCYCGPPGTCAGFYSCDCEHVPIPGCVDPGGACSGVGALDVVAATSVAPGTFMKVRGTAGIAYEADCDDRGECGDCTGSLAFREFGHSVILQPNFQTFGPGAFWQCQSLACEAVQTCTPMDSDTEYWAWGVAQEHAGSDPALSDVRLVVEGWCLATDAATFAGEYQGRITHNYGFHWDVTVVLEYQADGTLAVNLPALPCDACSGDAGDVPAQAATEVVVKDGTVRFKALVPNSYGVDPAFFTLAVDQNRIEGWFEADYGQGFPGQQSAGSNAVAIPGGNVTLERVFESLK